MKKITALLLAISFALGLVGCNGKAQDPENKEPEPTSANRVCNTKWDGKSLKVLCVGNSFAINATKVLYQIAQAHGVEEIVLGVLHIPGCTIATHWAKAQSGEATYQFYKNNSGKWEITANYTMAQGIEEEDWDVITFTQGSGLYGLKDAYGELDELVAFVNEKKTNPDAQLAFHMTWAFPPTCTNARFEKYANDQNVMYKCITDVAQNVVMPMGMDFVLPSGTAIQNARPATGEIFCQEDGYHLNGVGEYVAGYAWFVSLTGQPVEELKYLEDSISGPMKSTHEPILKAINASLENPFQTTPCS